MVRRASVLSILFLSLGLAFTVQADAGTANAAYQLQVDGDRVSLSATEAGLLDIIRDLGRQLEFQVIADGVADRPISDHFEGLTAREAVSRLCKATGYVEVPDLNTGRISRLVLTPGRLKGANRADARRDPLPARPRPTPTPRTDDQAAPKKSKADTDDDD